MTCQSCQASKETNGLWTTYDTLRCIYCTARLIKQIGTYRVSKDEIHARQLAVLRDAVATGQSAKEIRRLVKLDGAPLKEASK
jgi:hypothetical protein